MNLTDGIGLAQTLFKAEFAAPNVIHEVARRQCHVFEFSNIPRAHHHATISRVASQLVDDAL